MRTFLLAVLFAFVAYVAVVVIANRFAAPRSGPLTFGGAADLPAAYSAISVVTWNVGYAALGADMDFIADGGTRYLPRSRQAVLDNLKGIAGTLADIDADVFLLQEVARAGPMNYWVDVVDGLTPRFRGFASNFDTEVETRLLPPPLGLAHGAAIYSRLRVSGAERRPVTMQDERMGGVVLREYRMQVARLPMAGSDREWVVVNIHLSAFDNDGAVRRRQLADVMAFAETEFRAGNAVILGGDWNMEFEKSRFPHTTAEKDLFWIQSFPPDALPNGWSTVFDPAVPTTRTIHKSYVPGENYVTIIDGFIVSPNVETEGVRTFDKAFANSDHQPVLARFKLRPAG